MFDKRLFKELLKMNGYFFIETAAAIAVVSFTIYQWFLVAFIINDVFLKGVGPDKIMNKLLLLGALILVKAILNGCLEYYNRRVAIEIKKDFRRRYIGGIIKLGPSKLKNEKAGKFSTNFDQGIEAFDPFYSEFVPQLFVAAVEVPVILGVVVIRDGISFGIMLLTAPLIPVFMMLIGKMASYMSSRQWKSLQRMGGHFLDVVKGLTTLKLFQREVSQEKMIERVSEDFRETTMSVLKVSFLSALVLELVATISTAMLAVTLGVRLLYGKIGFENAFFILLLAPEYYQPLRQLGAKFHAAMGARAAADSVFPIVLESVENEIEKIKEFRTGENVRIEFNNVGYSYDGVNKAVDNIGFVIGGNSKIAFTGATGSGKSTLLALLMGVIRDYSGSIKINGIELSEIDRDAWSGNYAYVPQQPKLFKLSLLENIRIARPEADINEVMNVIEKIGLHELVNSLPRGIHTLLGEGGILLSGGQIQLVAIGRAILKNSAIVLLDEPTSALDVDTEEKINSAFQSLFSGKLVITIAHRLATIKASDHIFVLDHGYILEEGNHEELLRSAGYYSNLMKETAEVVE